MNRKIFFLNFIFRGKVLYFSVALRYENKKILAHGIRMKKNSQIRVDIVLQLFGYKVQLAISHVNFRNGIGNPEIAYLRLC